ncbi:MAG TPA: hypothetical protein VNT51_12125, partial [Miltoncostaeaceae bacterium]|nr:hypothetical protein [Miltoncostaeaceae bacterium]
PDPAPAPPAETPGGVYTPPDTAGTTPPPATAAPTIYIPVDVPVAARPDQPAGPTIVTTIPPGARPDAPTGAGPAPAGRDDLGGADLWVAPSVPVAPDAPRRVADAPPPAGAEQPAAPAPVQVLLPQAIDPTAPLMRGTESPLVSSTPTTPVRAESPVTRAPPPDEAVSTPPVRLVPPPYTAPSREHASLLEILAGYAFPGAGTQPSGAILLLFPLALLLAAVAPRIPRLNGRTLVDARSSGCAGYRAIALRPG